MTPESRGLEVIIAAAGGAAAGAAAMSELRILDGRYHEPFNDRGSDEVFTMIADWLRK